MNHLIYSLATIILACAGFAIAAFIRGKVTTKDTLVCPLNADCETVVHSRHSGFLGLKVTTWGMIYYGLTLVGTVSLMSLPILAIPGLTFLMFLMTVVAFIFSMYLTAVQAFVIREWCSWCLVSATICTAILILGFVHLGGVLAVLLAYFRIWLFMGYLLGLIAGVGGSIIYIVLFFKFLRDYKLSSLEKETLDTIGRVILVGLGVVLVTGLGLFIPLAAWYTLNPEFALAAIIVVMLVIQTIILKTDVVPQLSDLYESDVIPADDDHAYMRKKSFALGAVGLVSWIALSLISFINFQWSFVTLLVLYVIAVLGGVIWSLMSEYAVFKNSRQERL